MSDLFELLDAAAGPEPVTRPGAVEDDVTRGRRALARRRLAGTSAALAAAAAVALVSTTASGQRAGGGAGPGAGTVSVAPSPQPVRIVVPALARPWIDPRIDSMIAVRPGLAPDGWWVGGTADGTTIQPVTTGLEDQVPISLAASPLTAATRAAGPPAGAERVTVDGHETWVVHLDGGWTYRMDMGHDVGLFVYVPDRYLLSREDTVRILAAVTIQRDRMAKA